jgi:hypothetical protein
MLLSIKNFLEKEGGSLSDYEKKYVLNTVVITTSNSVIDFLPEDFKSELAYSQEDFVNISVEKLMSQFLQLMTKHYEEIGNNMTNILSSVSSASFPNYQN